MMSMRRISTHDGLSVLLVDHEDFRTRGTLRFLNNSGVDTVLSTTGSAALARFGRLRPDVVIVDHTLCDSEGVDICRELRAFTDIPIIMVSEASEEVDRVMALESGADDYVTKPFSNAEMLARIRAHARRARGRVGPAKQVVRVGELAIFAATLRATMRGAEVILTGHEFILLRELAERGGEVLTREQLVRLLGGKASGRTVDVHMSRIRQKLGDNIKDPELLKTVRGVGYMLRPKLTANGGQASKGGHRTSLASVNNGARFLAK